jgi:hypothetical protein
MSSSTDAMASPCSHDQFDGKRLSLTLTPVQIPTPLPPAPEPDRETVLNYVFQAASDDELSIFKGTPSPSQIPALIQFWSSSAHILGAQSVAELVMIILDNGRGRPKEAIEGLRVEDVGQLEGFNALHIAASRGSLGVCRYLVEELLLDVDLVDKEGASISKTLIYWFRTLRTHSV